MKVHSSEGTPSEGTPSEGTPSEGLFILQKQTGSSWVQSSSQLIRMESDSRSHEQISSCNNGACSTLYAYTYTIFLARRKRIDLLFSLQYQEVFQRAHQPSAERIRCQNYGGLLQSGILINLLIPCLIC